MSTPPTAPQVHATGLGRAEIRTGEAVITPISDRLFALAFHLCVRAGEYIPRDELVSLFWGDRERSKGRHSLRQMLYRLRQLEIPIVDAGDAVHLPEAAVACDVRAVLREGWEREAPEDLVRAGGELLAGGPQSYSEAYRDWYDGLEARVRTQLRRAALRFLGAAKREGRWGAVEEWALHVLRHDALNEEATLALAESMVMTGSKARALEVLDGYLAELGDRAERIGLPAKVLRKRIAAKGHRESSSGDRLPPLIGREELIRVGMAFLQGELAESTLLLEGPPGSGKTRIVADIETNAHFLGHVVIELRQTSSERRSTLAGLQVAAAQLLDAPGSAGASPETLVVLKALAAAHTATQQSHVPRTGHTSDEAISVALSDALAAVAEERPVLVIVEDVHHLSTLEEHPLIGAALGFAQKPIRLLITSRQPVQTTVNTRTPAERGIHKVTVNPLPSDAAILLAQGLLPTSDTYWTEIARSIAQRSGGIPLFIKTLATHAASRAPLSPLPDTLLRHIAGRIGHFTRDQLDVCETIHFLGHHSRLAWVREASLVGAASFQHILEHLEREGVIAFHHTGVLHLHDCWAEVIVPSITKATRAHRSLIAAETILSRIAHAQSQDAIVHAAHLLQEAGEHDRAFSLFTAAGEALYNQGLATDALDVFRRADNVARTAAHKAAAALNIALAEYSLGNVDSSYNAAWHGAKVACDRSQASVDKHLIIQSQLVDTAWRLQRPFSDTLSSLIASILDGRATPAAQHYAAFTAIRLLFNDRHDTRIAMLVAHVMRSAALRGSTFFSELSLLVAAAERGAPNEVSAIDERLSQMDTRTLPMHVHALGLRYRSQALRWSGYYERSLILSEQAATLTATYGLTNEASILAIQTGFLHLDLGDVAQATKAVSLARALSAQSNKERAIALWHLEARTLMQANAIPQAHALLVSNQEDILCDPLLKRKVSAAAMLAFTSSVAGDTRMALAMLDIARSVISAENPSLQLDFPCDTAIAALLNLGRDDESIALSHDYCERRRKIFPVRLAPALKHLVGGWEL